MSEVKVNKISPRSGTDVTLGDSGDTFTVPSGGAITIASGATITNSGTAVNFGPTGSVSWQTTVKTSGFTAAAGEGYFVDTSSGAISVNLPAGTAGAVVGFKDYLNSFDTHNLTLVQNGSDKIAGSAANAVLSTEGLGVTLVFVDSTQGWLVTDDGLQSRAPQPVFTTASGGTTNDVGDFRYHVFTGPGTFQVTQIGNSPSVPTGGPTNMCFMVVAGGGGGQENAGRGAGGGGGIRSATCSPLSVQTYPVTIGGGGAVSTTNAVAGCNGSPSTFNSVTSAGGGGGGAGWTGSGNAPSGEQGQPGGSGGGAANSPGTDGLGGGAGGDKQSFPGPSSGGSGRIVLRCPAADGAALSVSPGDNSVSDHPGGDKLATFNVSGTISF